MSDLFIKTIKEAVFLKPEWREKLLSFNDKITPEQEQKIIELVNNAREQYETAILNMNEESNAANKKYLKGMEDFFRHDVPAAMKKVEQKSQDKEEEELEGILTDLEKI
ncbi:hypothetical protein HN748_04180 [Candidatus Peregrinibacteria bacterium]|jgi:hypothetical protein|nr:hypothetical protein [Candidatus Peregrinibacteria bacterium]MBT7484499.1 hypothetical protein [Candidatus Peregrinibacteria bacterium]MBT7703408.1 hypothetical protein [Candidatus Peregrinibacteria bacterium]